MDVTVRFATTPEDRDTAFELRRAVFEVEQGVPRPLDRDAHDTNAHHVVAFEDGRCIGTGRLVRLDSRTGQIGRMAVAADRRRHGIGAAILDALERMAALRGIGEIVLNSQLPAREFFTRRGYVEGGDVFDDQGVPHVLMRKVLLPPAPPETPR
jgi:predicted GNAT family N-acyltransferase